MSKTKITENINSNTIDINNKNHTKIILFTFLISLTLAQIVFWIFLYLSGGEAMNTIVFSGFNNSYMDFFNMQYISLSDDPYGYTMSIYPPLCMLFFRFTTIFTNNEIFYYSVNYMPHFTEALFTLLVFTIICIIPIAIYVYSTKKGNPFIKTWFMLLVIFSTPFLHLYERGNIILISLIFLILFLLGYTSEKKWIRELSYVALAISASIKLYPALFGILILKEKRIKEALHCVLYGVLIFVIPAFAYDGFATITDIINNISKTSANYESSGLLYRVDIFAGLDLISLTLGLETISTNVVKYGLWGLLVIGLILTVIFSKSKWRSLTALTLLSICIPSFAWEYSLIFMIIPLLSFMDTDEKRGIIDYFYMIMYIIMLAPLTAKNLIITLGESTHYYFYLYTYLAPLAVIFMIILLVTENLIKMLLDFKKSRSTIDNNNNNNVDDVIADEA